MRRREPSSAPLLDWFNRAAAHVAAQNQALGRDRKLRRRRNTKSAWTPARQTLSDIADLIRQRHGEACDTDDGEAYLQAALPWLIEASGGLEAEGCRAKVLEWVTHFTPRLTNEAVDAQIAEARQRNKRQRLYWDAAQLGDLLRLSIAKRESLDIRRIRPAGMSAKAFKTYQRKKKTINEKTRRVASGAKPREQSAAQLKPWVALGMSERTYQRRKKEGALPGQIRDRLFARGRNSCPIGTEYLQHDTNKRHASKQTAQGPAKKARPRLTRSADGPSPGGKTRAVPTGHARALPLPTEGVSEHPDMIGGFQQIGDVLLTYMGGSMSPDLARAVREALHARMLTQAALAQQIGISPPHLANVLKRRFGLSKSTATNLMEWLTAT